MENNPTVKPNRFRFRAWDVKERRMLKLGCMMFQGEVNEVVYLNIDGALGTVSTDERDLIVQQSTGLLDAEGREVFEGDILTWDGFTRSVEWNDTTATLTLCREFRPQIPVYMHARRAKIIGNIYENPELLK